MKIWQRYILKDILKVMLFFLVSFYSLYVLIDYANKTAAFHYHHVHPSWLDIAIYYAAEFIKRLEVLLPFAILIATVRVLTKLNQNHEMVALLCAGIKLRKLMMPFIWVGLAGTLLLYINEEFAYPTAVKYARGLEDKRRRESQRKNETPQVNYLVLEDGSTLLFQSYDSTNHQFFDTYWIKSIDEIWRMKYVSTPPKEPHGVEVEILKRNPAGQLVVAERIPDRDLVEMRFNQNRLIETITQADELNLSHLFTKLPPTLSAVSEKEARTLSALIQKLLLPWLALLAVLGPLPQAAEVTRNLKVFFIFSFWVFVLVFIYLVMESALMLANRQVINPYIALITPFAIISSIISYRFYRIGSV